MSATRTYDGYGDNSGGSDGLREDIDARIYARGKLLAVFQTSKEPILTRVGGNADGTGIHRDYRKMAPGESHTVNWDGLEAEISRSADKDDRYQMHVVVKSPPQTKAWDLTRCEGASAGEHICSPNKI